MSCVERVAVRLRLVYSPEVRCLRQRERTLRRWRRAKLLNTVRRPVNVLGTPIDLTAPLPELGPDDPAYAS